MGLGQVMAILLLMLLDIQIVEFTVQPTPAVLVFRHITYFLFAMHILFGCFNNYVHRRQFESLLNSVKELESILTQGGIRVRNVSKVFYKQVSRICCTIMMSVFVVACDIWELCRILDSFPAGRESTLFRSDATRSI